MSALVVAALTLLALRAGEGPARGRLRALVRMGTVQPTESVREGVDEPDEALLLDLVAAALRAGVPVPTALRLAGHACGGLLGSAAQAAGTSMLLGATGEAAWRDAANLRALRRCVTLALECGVPAVPLLHASADTCRRDRHRSAERAAGRLGVRLVLPLGLCAVPAFAAWGVVPVVLSLASQVLR